MYSVSPLGSEPNKNCRELGELKTPRDYGKNLHGSKVEASGTGEAMWSLRGCLPGACH